MLFSYCCIESPTHNSLQSQMFGVVTTSGLRIRVIWLLSQHLSLRDERENRLVVRQPSSLFTALPCVSLPFLAVPML
eukprot:SAG22_NODE_807_length_7081_cov_2.460756_8_plen_77_part_00